MESKKPIDNAEAAASLKRMLSKPDGKEKLYTVLKALSAMKLTKEDPTPSLILSIRDSKLVLSQSSDESAFLYQGSVGAAFNDAKLKEYGITHILTCASGIGQRFPDKFCYQ